MVIRSLLNSTFALSQNNIWQDTNLSAKSSNQFGLSHYFDANDQALRNKLNLAPNDVRGVSDTIELSMPDGSLAKFSITKSSIMEDGLADKFPQIKGRVFIDPINNSSNINHSMNQVFVLVAPVNLVRLSSAVFLRW